MQVPRVRQHEARLRAEQPRNQIDAVNKPIGYFAEVAIICPKLLSADARHAEPVDCARW